MNLQEKIAQNQFKFRDYQKPIVEALNVKGYRKLLAILPRRCIHEDTHITMADGSFKLLKDIIPGDKILSFNGKKIETDVVKKIWHTGSKKIIEVKSPKNLSIFTTPDHVFANKIQNGKILHWDKISQIKNYRYLLTYIGLNQQDNISNEDLAEFLGYMICDGYVSGYQQPKFTNVNPDILDRVEYLATKLFNVIVIKRKKGNAFDYGFSNGTKGGGYTPNPIKDFFRNENLDVPKSKKRLFKLFWKLDINSLGRFFAAVLSSDGSIYVHKPRFKFEETVELTINCGSSYLLGFDLYWLLRKMGFLPHVPYLEKGSNWKLRLSRSDDVKKILSFGPVYGKEELQSKALDALKKYKKQDSSKFIKYSKFKITDENLSAETYDLETKKNHNFFANGYLVHNSGKDMVALHLALFQALQRVCTIYYIFPTYSQARKALWTAITIDGQRILDFIPDTLAKKNSSEMSINFKNGSVIQLIGSDRFDRLRGTNPYGCIFSEYAYQDPRAYTTIRPVLAANGGWALFCSTPFGKNHFYDLYQIAQNSPDWFCYKLTVNDTNHIPWEELEKERIELSPDMFEQEYFTSFEAGVEGSYYAKYINKIRLNNQITSVPWESSFPVHTAWDIGVRDSTSIIFFQTIGQSVRIIDFYEKSKEGLEHYVTMLNLKPYTYGKHFAPHDIAVKEFGSGLTRIEKAKRLGVTFTLAPNISIEDGIEAVRSSFSKMYFDEVKCKELVRALENYRQEWDAKKKVYKPTALHDIFSHASDAFRYLCLSLSRTSDGLSAEELNKRFQKAMYPDFNPLITPFKRGF